MQNAEKVCEFNQDLFWLNLQLGDKSGEGIFCLQMKRIIIQTRSKCEFLLTLEQLEWKLFYCGFIIEAFHYFVYKHC